MKERIYVFIWKHTGWVPGEWARRDNYAMQDFWMALVEAERAMTAGRFYEAHDRVRQALR